MSLHFVALVAQWFPVAVDLSVVSIPPAVFYSVGYQMCFRPDRTCSARLSFEYHAPTAPSDAAQQHLHVDQPAVIERFRLA